MARAIASSAAAKSSPSAQLRTTSKRAGRQRTPVTTAPRPPPRGTACSRPRPRRRAGRAPPEGHAPSAASTARRALRPRSDVRTTRATTPVRVRPPARARVDPRRRVHDRSARRGLGGWVASDAGTRRPTPTRVARRAIGSGQHGSPRRARGARETDGRRRHPADRRMRRIQRPARASRPETDHEADSPDAGVEQRGDGARIDHGREREVPEGCGTHDHRRQARLGRQRTRLGDRVEPVPERRREAVDGIGGPAPHRRRHRQRAGRGAHAGRVVLGRPSGERVGEREPELGAHVHPPEVAPDRVGPGGETVDGCGHRAPTAELRRDLFERGGQPRRERALAAGAGEAPAPTGPATATASAPAAPSTGDERGREQRHRSRSCRWPSTRRPARVST